MTKARFWSPKKRAVAFTLRSEGYTYPEIAKRIGGKATHSGVLKLCRKFETSQCVTDKSQSGRKRKSTDREDRQLVRLCFADRHKTSAELQREWKPDVCASTIRRRLIANGLNRRIPRKKPFLNKLQRSKRLQWAKDHKDWSNEQWARVLWSDESKISIFGTDGVHYVRCRNGEDLSPQCLLPTMTHPLSVMIWSCMSSTSIGRLHICEGWLQGRSIETKSWVQRCFLLQDHYFSKQMLPLIRYPTSSTNRTVPLVTLRK